MKSEYAEIREEILNGPRKRAYSSWWLVLICLAVAVGCYAALVHQGIKP